MSKVEMTNPDKIIYPKEKITKKQIIEYYRKVSSRLILHIKDHPLALQRYPNGIKKEGFFQKNVSKYFPKWIKTVRVSRQASGKVQMVLCNDKNTVEYLANQAALSLHPWLSTRSKLDKPDRMIFDLDPPQRNLQLAKEAARDLKKFLETLGLKPFIMTTGSKGYHIVVPIQPLLKFEEVRKIARIISNQLSKKFPKKYTTQTRKNARKGRLFIDYLRNSYAQHAIAPYSLRALPGAPIAMPILWQELSRVEPQSFHLKNISSRLKKPDPWSRMKSSQKSLSTLMKKLETHLE